MDKEGNLFRINARIPRIDSKKLHKVLQQFILRALHSYIL